jgi:maltose O-acetyltransferase
MAAREESAEAPAPVGVTDRLAHAPLAFTAFLVGTRLVNLASWLLGVDRVSARLRRELLRLYGWQIGAATLIDAPSFAYGAVVIGAGCYINRDCYFDGETTITLGDRVLVGPGAMFLTGSHQLGSHRQRGGALEARPIQVGAGAWIGARATILPGVHIGDGAVVAAGAVVTADVPPDTLVAGVPAQVKRTLSPGEV